MFKRIIPTLKQYNFKHINVRLILYVIVLTIIGILAIGSATEGEHYQSRQIMGFTGGMICLVMLIFISYKFIFKLYWPIYILNLILLVVVLFFGDVNMGAGRWLDLGFVQFQPSEFSKLAIILFLVVYLEKHKETINSFKTLATATVLSVISFVLILKEPDLSTTIVIFITFCVIMFLSGINYKIITSILVVMLPIVCIVGYLAIQPDSGILKPYQYKRIVGFYQEDNEEAKKIRYQQENSLLAIGSGGLTGKGLDNSTVTSVKNGNLLSEAHTDFIFTIIGEELGFAGSSAVIILLLLIVFECFLTGARAPTLSGRLFCYGFGFLIAFQSFVNISVTTMLLPNTGLTLPFVSSGLTSLLSLYCGMGIILNIGLQRKKDLY